MYGGGPSTGLVNSGGLGVRDPYQEGGSRPLVSPYGATPPCRGDGSPPNCVPVLVLQCVDRGFLLSTGSYDTSNSMLGTPITTLVVSVRTRTPRPTPNLPWSGRDGRGGRSGRDDDAPPCSIGSRNWTHRNLDKTTRVPGRDPGGKDVVGEDTTGPLVPTTVQGRVGTGSNRRDIDGGNGHFSYWSGRTEGES